MINKSLNYAYPRNYAEGGEVKSQSYSFVHDGNSYNMGDYRPGHEGTSLERAIANVQEHYDLAPGSFTVNNNTTQTLMGTYDSGSGNFKSASEPDSGDIFGATTMAMGEEDASFSEPSQEQMLEKIRELEATTMMVGEEDGGQTVPPDEGMVTTMAMGEEDAPRLDPDMDEIHEFFAEKVKRDFGDEPMFPETPAPPTAPLLRSNPFFDMPLQPVESPYPNPNAFTRAVGENGGGGNLFQSQLPVVPGESLRPTNQLAAPVKMRPIEGRTYGMYSNTPVLETNSIQPFTPYIAPQQLQSSGIESLVQNNSAPRTSVFKRS